MEQFLSINDNSDAEYCRRIIIREKHIVDIRVMSNVSMTRITHVDEVKNILIDKLFTNQQLIDRLHVIIGRDNSFLEPVGTPAANMHFLINLFDSQYAPTANGTLLLRIIPIIYKLTPIWLSCDHYLRDDGDMWDRSGGLITSD